MEEIKNAYKILIRNAQRCEFNSVGSEWGLVVAFVNMRKKLICITMGNFLTKFLGKSLYYWISYTV
jgi:hypothetical protein